MITIFTPTYNRAYRITDLYKSLCEQDCNDFEWLIVDDGSTDDTESVVNGFVSEGKIAIRYYKQPNGGKHRAINKAVALARGEIFFIVDSDDTITPDAVSWIKTEFEKIKDRTDLGGISGIKIYSNGEKAGGGDRFEPIEADAVDIRQKYHVTGDLAEVFWTDVMREFPFPDHPGEKFCPEALVWNRIATKYKLRYLYKPIYICEYLPDGLTSKIMKIRHNSPCASMEHYSELFAKDIPLAQKIKAAINFWRFTPAKYYKKACGMKMINCLSLTMMPAGWLMRLNDNRKL